MEVRGNVTQVMSHGVQFQDGAEEEVDAIIMATGYDYRLDFVDPEVVKVRSKRLIFGHSACLLDCFD